MGPLFSIIIPSLNQGRFIAQAIDSILNQSYKNTEIIVMDGGSNDQTLEILKSYGNNIFWRSEKDKGQADAINKGISLANGLLIAYLNSDDYFLKGTLEKVADAYQKQNAPLWITGDYIIVDEQGKIIHSLIAKYKYYLRKFCSFYLLTILNPIAQPSTFISKELINKIGQFSEDLHYTMDYEYWLRASQIQNPVIINQELSAFRIHINSKGGSQYKKQFEEELSVAKKYQQNPLALFLHYLHNLLIGIVYKIIK